MHDVKEYYASAKEYVLQRKHVFSFIPWSNDSRKNFDHFP